MKITSSKLVMDPTTLSPQMHVVVQLPMDHIQDQMALDPQFFEKFGREFFSLLEQSRST